MLKPMVIFSDRYILFLKLMVYFSDSLQQFLSLINEHNTFSNSK